MNNIGFIITTFLLLFTIATLIFNSIFNNVIISKYFSEIEKQDTLSKINQSKKIFDYQINNIKCVVKDYAIWDDVYDKMQDEVIDENWFTINYPDWLVNQLDINLIIVANRSKDMILQYGLNGNSNIILDNNKVSELFNQDIYNENSSFSGFIQYDGNIYLIGACPIFKTTTEGISKGVVILGRKISPTFIKGLEDQLGTDIFITYNDQLICTDDIQKELENHNYIYEKNKDTSVYELDDSKIIGNYPIIDISTTNLGHINIIQSRDMFVSTRNLIEKNTFFAAILSGITLFLLGFKLKGIIVNPIKKLENEIKSMKDEDLLVHTNISGPNEIISLSESFNHMVDSIHEHKKENEELKLTSNIDSLTSAFTHKYYFESINRKISEGHKQISVLFCDIDKFKLTNDTYGHKTGDLLLIEIAKIMKDEIKDNGMVFRYGGEEFAIILWDYTSEEAFVEAEIIRNKVSKSSKLQQYIDYFPITISIGISSYPNHALDAASLIQKADIAMYYSKQNGRNQCTTYRSDLNDFFKNSKEFSKKELVMDSALSLSEAVDAKDDYTGKHSKMVSKYSILIAEKLNFTEEEKNILRIGALLHDCGKIGIPDNIISKPEKLSDDEFEMIKNHTILGNNIIKYITNDQKIVCCVRSHHERWDGKGYPDGISGTSINLFARIVCIADVYHAMASDRPYRRALPKETVLQEFIKGRGTQFDPELTDIIVEMIKESKIDVYE
jgi:diguanylate cyclase (GGDEF)-like protein/putative nucleotidyltransferase with HDIG domain